MIVRMIVRIGAYLPRSTNQLAIERWSTVDRNLSNMCLVNWQGDRQSNNKPIDCSRRWFWIFAHFQPCFNHYWLCHHSLSTFHRQWPLAGKICPEFITIYLIFQNFQNWGEVIISPYYVSNRSLLPSRMIIVPSSSSPTLVIFVLDHSERESSNFLSPAFSHRFFLIFKWISNLCDEFSKLKFEIDFWKLNYYEGLLKLHWLCLTLTYFY